MWSVSDYTLSRGYVDRAIFGALLFAHQLSLRWSRREKDTNEMCGKVSTNDFLADVFLCLWQVR